MTKEETAEAIKVMQAYVDGKKIEMNYYGDEFTWKKCKEPEWNWFSTDYRIEPNQEEPKEKHYRPYTMEEFVEDMHKHDGFIRYDNPQLIQYGCLIVAYDKDKVEIIDQKICYLDLYVNFVWSDDGQPCGKEVTE